MFSWVIVKPITVIDGPQMNATGLYTWSFNIGSGSGLVPSGNKPFTEPMLTLIYVAQYASIGHNV